MQFARFFSSKIIVTLLMSVFLWACSSDLKKQPQLSQKQQIGLRSAIIKNYNKWRGVPYRLGGQSHRGIDCSGFVQVIYRDAVGKKLPRNTRQQKSFGKPVSKKYLQIGDLVFFNRNTHVGIYVGKGKFIHASTKKGVSIADLSNVYFRKNYTQSRRVLFPRR